MVKKAGRSRCLSGFLWLGKLKNMKDKKLTLIKFLYKKLPQLWQFFVLYLTCYDKRGCAIINFDLLFVKDKMIWAMTTL